MNNKKNDLFLYSLSFFLLIFSSKKLFFEEENFSSSLNRGAKIATLSNKINDVRVKFSDDLTWYQAKGGKLLFNNDQIFVHTDSQANIVFENGAEVTIGSNSLLKVTQGVKTEIELEKGSISAKIGKKALVLKTGNDEINLNSTGVDGETAEIKLELSGEDVEIAVLEGEIETEVNGKLEIIEEGSILEKKGEVYIKSDVNIRLISPAHNSVFYLSEYDEIDFSFSTDSDSIRSVEVSSDSNFENIISTREVKGNKFSISWDKSKTVYWRITTDETENFSSSKSSTYSFRVFENEPPEIVSPSNEDNFLISKTKSSSETFLDSVYLQWEDEIDRGYELEVLKDNKIFKKHSLRSKQFLFPLSVVGEYSFRVRAANPDNSFSDWSELTKFSVNESYVPISPDNLVFEEFINTDNREENEVEIEWDRSPGATGYNILVSRDKDFNKIEKEVYTASTSIDVELKALGRYYFKIKSMDKYERNTVYSTVKSFVLNVETPELIVDNDEVTLYSPTQSHSFKWEAQGLEKNIKQSFEIQISRDEDFNNVIWNKEVDSNKFEWKRPELGIFYWRVRETTYLKDSKYSNIEEIQFFKSKPIKIEGLEDLKLEIEKRLKKDPKILFIDFFIKKAFADESMEEFVKIYWPEASNAKEYLIEVYLDEKLEKKVFSKKSNFNWLVWTDPTVGSYYYRVAYTDLWGQKSDFSNIAELSVFPPGESPPPTRSLLNFPANNEEIMLTENGDEDISFGWSKEEVSEYILEFALDDDFENIIHSTKTQESLEYYNSENFKKNRSHFWRVISVDRYGRSATSDIRSFKILEYVKEEEVIIDEVTDEQLVEIKGNNEKIEDDINQENLLSEKEVYQNEEEVKLVKELAEQVDPKKEIVEEKEKVVKPVEDKVSIEEDLKIENEENKVLIKDEEDIEFFIKHGLRSKIYALSAVGSFVQSNASGSAGGDMNTFWGVSYRGDYFIGEFGSLLIEGTLSNLQDLTNAELGWKYDYSFGYKYTFGFGLGVEAKYKAISIPFWGTYNSEIQEMDTSLTTYGLGLTYQIQISSLVLNAGIGYMTSSGSSSTISGVESEYGGNMVTADAEIEYKAKYLVGVNYESFSNSTSGDATTTEYSEVKFKIGYMF